MKKYIISVAMCLALGLQAFAQTTYLEGISLSNRSVQKTAARTVKVSMDMDLSRLDMKKQHSLQLVPVIISADGSREQALPPVVVEGKIRHKVNARHEKLQKEELYPGAVATVRRYNGKEQTLSYEAEVPFRQWMIGGQLVLRGNVDGCAMCSEGNETAYTGNVLPPMNTVYATPFITPKEETVKRRSETRAARLQFRQDSHKILPEYKENEAEIAKVRESLELVKKNTDLSITGIYVTGYASPEGTAEYNMELSERRAKSFTEYIKNDIDGIDPSLYHVDWKGEDWEELRRQVELHPRLLKQDQVLKLIDECDGNIDECEERIKALVPKEIYQRVLNEMYGPIRRNEYRIEYNVRHFDLEEGKRMIDSRPELMSVSEIQTVADSYGKGTPQYVHCLVQGAKAYPRDVTAVNNAALALIEAGRPAEAVTILESAPEDAALLNVLGVASLKAGDARKAASAFDKAIQKGSTDARANKEAMNAYLQYMAE